MAGTAKRIAGPAFIASAATNVYTPPASTMYICIRHIHITNVTGGAVAFSLYVGATGGSAGGTEIEKSYSLAAAGTAAADYDKYFGGQGLVMKSTDFLTALDGNGAALVITVLGDQLVIP